MKKRVHILFLALLAAALTALTAAAAGDYTVSVLPAPAGDYAAVEDIPVTMSADKLFCGWFTTESAARSLNTLYAAEKAADARYGAVLQLPEAGALRLIGAQMYTKSPYGVRFVTETDKALLRTLERLHGKNRAGKNDSITPKNEHATGIGYGTVLALDLDTTVPLEKKSGRNVRGGITVPGVYTCGETDTTLRYTATVLKVAAAQTADKIAARPYITYADANGTVRTWYYTESGRQNCAYATSLYSLVEAVEADADASDEAKAAAAAVRKSYAAPAVKVTKITALNTDSVENSADFANAYVEADYTTMNFLSTGSGAHVRYTKSANYSRIIKVKNNLYLMFFQYSQFGQHLYYSTSTDGIHWSATPNVLYNANAAANKFTYTDGPLAGTTDAYYAVNADAVLLKDGSVMVVYARRPCKGYPYREYMDMNSLEMVRMTVSASNRITVGKPTTIYRGVVWEPEIIRRANGQIQVYITHAAPMIDIYGYQSEKRSSGVGVIVSDDNGKTWTPTLAEMKANHYAAKRVYQQFSKKMTIDGESVNFYSGQMPAVVEMTDGRLLLFVEFEPAARDGMLISAALSDTDGEWDELGIDEAGPNRRYESMFKGAAPSLCRFPSGEILLSYNTASKMYTRLLKKDARDLSDITAVYEMDPFGTDTTKTRGYWSTVAVKDSHTAILSMAFPRYENYGDGNAETEEDNSAIGVVFGRLNHTVNALHKTVVADGNPQEWSAQKEALFVGSKSAAQASYRFAYDDEKIYVCIDYLNASRADSDSLFVSFEKTNGSTVTARISGAGSVTAVTGITGGAVLTTDGGVYELALDRATLGLSGENVRVRPGFTAGGVTDVIDGTTTDASTWLRVNLASKTAVANTAMETKLFTIADLNTNAADGDHMADDYTTASVEGDFRSKVLLNSATTGSFRYDNAFYPRVKKVRDDLYLLLYHYTSTGQHLYYALSRDGVNWDAPQVLYNRAEHDFVYDYGDRLGEKDGFYAVNPEAVVLDNGEILCVYSVRPCNGYKTYTELSGLDLIRGTVTADGKIEWSAPTRIYTGQNWEASFLKHDDGRLEIYFTQIAPYISRYGYDDSYRSSGTGMLVSNDNGYTWTPNILPGDTADYRTTTVFQQQVGTRNDLPYFCGQMPVAVSLANGKTMLAVEIRRLLQQRYDVSYALSDENGAWKALDFTEEGPDTMRANFTRTGDPATWSPTDPSSGSSPYLSRFDSGEVVMTYTYANRLLARIGAPDGSGFSDAAFSILPDAPGIWGSMERVGSHAMLFANQATSQDGATSGIAMIRAYLNHRINAPKIAMQTNAGTRAWDDAGATDALFVGSASQAQLALRVAHDDDYVYFLASVLDYNLESGDSVTLCIAESDTTWYRLTVGLFGGCSMKKATFNGTKITYSAAIPGAFAYVKLFGTPGNTDDTDEGYLMSIAIPKSLVGLDGASSFRLRPALTNYDGTTKVSDTLTGDSTITTNAAHWPSVVLD